MNKFKFKHYHEPWGRGYEIDSFKFPGVGSVLSLTKSESSKWALINWKKSLGDDADRVSREALDRGLNWHKYLEYYISGYSDKANELLKGIPSNKEIAKHSSHLLKRMKSVDVLATEFPVYSKMGYAGTFDCLAQTRDGLTLLDWKTATKIKDPKYVGDYYLQLAAYANGIKECYGLTIEKAYIVVFYTFKQPDYFSMDKQLLQDSLELFKERLKMFYEMIKKEVAMYERARK